MARKNTRKLCIIKPHKIDAKNKSMKYFIIASYAGGTGGRIR
jgi:hypothetical protein